MREAPSGDVGGRVAALIEKEARRPLKIAGHSSLVGDLELESIQLVALVCAIEVEFDIALEYEDVRTVRTVDDLTHAIEKALG